MIVNNLYKKMYVIKTFYKLWNYILITCVLTVKKCGVIYKQVRFLAGFFSGCMEETTARKFLSLR